MDDFHRKSIASQVMGKQLRNICFVLNDQDFFSHHSNQEFRVQKLQIWATQ